MIIYPGVPGNFSDYNHSLVSNAGKGPRGDGISISIIETEHEYRIQFKNDRTGKVYATTPNLISLSQDLIDQIKDVVMQWLDEHPEIMVPDYGITTDKIADRSVTPQKLASGVVDVLPDMSRYQRGVARVGTGLVVSDGTLSLDGGNISSAVAAWLDIHPEATTTVEDEAISTSKIANKAVTTQKIDTKAITPDKLNESSIARTDLLYEDLYDRNEYDSTNWVNSDMDDTGHQVESTARVTTQGWRTFDGVCYSCSVDEGYKFKVLMYKNTETPKVVLIDWRTNRYDFLSNVRKWIVVAAKIDDSSITISDAEEHVHISTYTPKKLVIDETEILHDMLPYVSTEPSYYVQQNSIIRYVNGVVSSDNNYSATGYVDVSGCKYVVYSRLTFNIDSTPRGGVAFYRHRDVSSYISGEPANGYAESVGYETRVCEVPHGASYMRLTINPQIDGFFVRGIPGKSHLDGLKLSVLGDSISTYSGYIPAGNHAFYNGERAGVSSVDQMWWKILCDVTGMEPLVIDAWGGSAIAYNASTKPTHLDTVRIPMCSTQRTGRLGTETVDPDVIIVAGGTNDWFFGNQSTTPIGEWDGYTDIDESLVSSGDSTFIESYVSMLHKLQHNYPNAIIVCSSTFFVVAKNDTTIRKNDAGKIMADYNLAIRKACEIVGVPFIDVFDVGFTYENYYGTYCVDSATESLHPNALGQEILAKRYIEELPRLVKQFVR